MKNLSNIAIIGSGPTALYLLQHISTHIDVLKNKIDSITIFEKEEIIGMGMPYNPKTTDIYNLSNISSVEIPMLIESFGDWLRKMNLDDLKKLNVKPLPIDDTEVYSRVALGHYFHDQFKRLIAAIKSKGVLIFEKCNAEIVDIYQAVNNELIVIDSHNNENLFSTVVIANGHDWTDEDKVESGYYVSPWPIHKLMPKENDLYNFTVGTLGASLSAFDVVTSLTHRHGKFITVDNKLKYIKNENTPYFKIVLHSTKGWLPHLQYEQQEPIREIYRHFSRSQMLDLIDENGFINIGDYFDNLCRPALISAFTKDKLFDVVAKLHDETFSLKDLVALMSEKHEYINSFEGMRSELIIAKKHNRTNTPVFWMETLDDLMYSLNYHAELLPAEDHIFFHDEIMSFLMNVIAALPLQSAEILLALYEANCVEIKAGLVSFEEDSFVKDKTIITVELEDGSFEKLEYKLFVNCGGQKMVELENYPFNSLVKQGLVKCATAKFANPKNVDKESDDRHSEKLIYNGDGIRLKISGIDIDSIYRTINSNGNANDFLYDINFTHANGLRPYSYGLQACNATSLILVESWMSEIVDNKDVSRRIETITELYEENEDL